MNKILAEMIRGIADDLEDGKYVCSDEQLTQAIDQLASFNSERHLSKQEACQYLNISRSSFDTYVRNGIIPKGEKRMGFKELSWVQADLDKVIEDLKELGYK